MDGKMPLAGFDERAFWEEANVALAKGTREMLLNSRDKTRIIAAYDRMDYALGGLVARTDPHEEVRRRLYDKLQHRIALLSAVLESDRLDADQSWEADMKKVSIIVLKAFGKAEDVVSIPGLVDDAAAALCKGNFTEQGAKVFIAEMSTYGCRGLKGMLKELQDTPSHMDFLRLLRKEGVLKARKAAQEAMEKMVPAMTATIKAPAIKVRAEMGKLLHMPSMRRPQAPQPSRRA